MCRVVRCDNNFLFLIKMGANFIFYSSSRSKSSENSTGYLKSAFSVSTIMPNSISPVSLINCHEPSGSFLKPSLLTIYTKPFSLLMNFPLGGVCTFKTRGLSLSKNTNTPNLHLHLNTTTALWQWRTYLTQKSSSNWTSICHRLFHELNHATVVHFLTKIIQKFSVVIPFSFNSRNCSSEIFYAIFTRLRKFL